MSIARKILKIGVNILVKKIQKNLVTHSRSVGICGVKSKINLGLYGKKSKITSCLRG
jgi:hypothetical protein